MMLLILICSLTTRVLVVAVVLLPAIKTNGSVLLLCVGTEFIMAAALLCQRYWRVLKGILSTQVL